MPQRGMFFKGKTAITGGSQSKQEGEVAVDDAEEAVKDEAEAGSGTEKMECSVWCSKDNVARAGQLLWRSFRESYSSRHFHFSQSPVSLHAMFVVQLHTIYNFHTLNQGDNALLLFL